MSDNLLHIEENETNLKLELEINPKPIWVQVLVFLSLFLVGIFSLVFIKSSIVNFAFSSTASIIGSLLLLLLTWYFFKLFLWFRGGKEIFTIHEDRIDYYSDYQLFKQNRKSYPYNHFYMIYWDTDGTGKGKDESILDDLSQEEGYAILGFELDSGKEIDTTIELPFSELRRLATVLDNRNLRKRK